MRAPAVRFLTQEQLVRKAVIEGLSRALRQVYTEEQVGPPTEYIKQLLARLSNNEHEAWPVAARREFGLRALRR